MGRAFIGFHELRSIVILTLLIEELDLLELWHLYGQIKRVAEMRRVSISKVSRSARTFLNDHGFMTPEVRGALDPQLLRYSGLLVLLRCAFQEWRQECGYLKLLPTFSASLPLRDQSLLRNESVPNSRLPPLREQAQPSAVSASCRGYTMFVVP